MTMGDAVQFVEAPAEKFAELAAADLECRLCREPAVQPVTTAFGFCLLCKRHAEDALTESDEMLTTLRMSLQYGTQG